MATRFNTGNPIDSADPRDGSDNMANLDQMVNSAGQTFTDRFGVSRKTLTGYDTEIQSRVDNAVASWVQPDNTGDWATGTAYTEGQLWKEAGEYYFVLADYTSGASAAADIAAGHVAEYTNTARQRVKTSIADLEASTPFYDGEAIYLSAGGRSGTFEWHVGDYSSEVAADTLQGVYIAPSSDATGASGAWVRKLDGCTVSVEMFGARANKVDCSEEVSAAVKFVISNANSPTIGSNNVLSGGVLFEGGDLGEYLINIPQSLLPNTGSTRYVGLSFFSVSQGTTIHFGYDGDDYLCYNNNQHLFLHFSNLRFTCNSDTAKFMYSTGNGGAQNVYFDKVSWQGVWQKLFVLRGANNNSEWGWQKCSITASIRDVMFDSSDSDQFLNYWWNMCKLWLYDGQCIRSSAGGHYKFTSCDWSGLEAGMTLNQSTNGGHLFELLGSSHARGVCALEISGGRFEHKTSQSKLLYCEWNQGSVNIDADCLSTLYTDQTIETVHFKRSSVQGPSVKFSGSHQGVHRYSSAVGAFAYQACANYENVQTVHTQINDFIKVDSDINAGSNWSIECNSVQSKGNQSDGQLVMNATIGGLEARGSSIQRRSFKFADAQGKGTPSTTNRLTAIMPSGALITKVTWYSSGSLTSAVAVDFTLKDGLGNAISNHADTLSNAWYVVDDVAHQLTESSNSIYIEDSNGVANQQSSTVWCMIEYVFG